MRCPTPNSESTYMLLYPLGLDSYVLRYGNGAARGNFTIVDLEFCHVVLLKVHASSIGSQSSQESRKLNSKARPLALMFSDIYWGKGKTNTPNNVPILNKTAILMAGCIILYAKACKSTQRHVPNMFSWHNWYEQSAMTIQK